MASSTKRGLLTYFPQHQLSKEFFLFTRDESLFVFGFQKTISRKQAIFVAVILLANPKQVIPFFLQSQQKHCCVQWALNGNRTHNGHFFDSASAESIRLCCQIKRDCGLI